MLKQRITKTNIIIALVVLFTIVFGSFNFTNTEFSVYESFNRSLVYDGDLNIANQLFYKNDKGLLSKTGYFYSHHSYGSALLLSPIAFYSHYIGRLFGLKSDTHNYQSRTDQTDLRPFYYKQGSLEWFESFSMSFGAYCLFLFSLFLLIKEFKIRYGINNPHYDLVQLLIFISSPAYFYLTYAQSTPNLLVLFPLAFLFYLSRNSDELVNNFLIGLAFGLGMIIRIDFGIYGLFILSWWFIYKLDFKRISLQGLGLLIMLVPAIVFEYSRLGSFTVGYLETFYMSWITVFDLVFSPYGGVFTIHPLMLFLYLLGLFKVIQSLKIRKFSLQEVELITIFSILSLRTVLLGFTYSHNSGVFGGRQLLQDFLLLGMILLPCHRFSRKYYFPLIMLSIVNIFLSMGFEFPDLHGSAIFLFGDTYSSFFIKAFDIFLIVVGSFTKILNLDNLRTIVLNYLIPLLGMAFLIKYLLKERAKYVLCVFALMNIFIISLDRVRGAQSNPGLLKRATSVDALMYYENMGSLMERIGFLEGTKTRSGELEEIEKIMIEYHHKIKKEMKIDSDEEFFEYFRALKAEPYFNDFRSRLVELEK
ncbi:MAG: hypothetical protein ACJAT2_001324 [Bacteriovoracaceae bacterium]|jgi:hypothetical protein